VACAGAPSLSLHYILSPVAAVRSDSSSRVSVSAINPVKSGSMELASISALCSVESGFRPPDTLPCAPPDDGSGGIPHPVRQPIEAGSHSVTCGPPSPTSSPRPLRAVGEMRAHPARRESGVAAPAAQPSRSRWAATLGFRIPPRRPHMAADVVFRNTAVLRRLYPMSMHQAPGFPFPR
jgi:hypothetical protein